ncbi:MAG: hypothetical protein [Bacteriophage sp.]|nr:MAG: hypothetical protein [Bacteriophage sp.]
MSTENKECAAAITPLLNGHKGRTIYCNAPRVNGTLFCDRHQHSMDRVYLATVTLSEYDYYRTDLDRFNS